MARDRGYLNGGSGSNPTIVVQTVRYGGKRDLEKIVSITEHSTINIGGKRGLELDIVKDIPLP